MARTRRTRLQSAKSSSVSTRGLKRAWHPDLAVLAILAGALVIRLWGIADRLPDPSLGIRVFDDSVVEETDRVTMGMAWGMWRGGTQPFDPNPHTAGWPALSAYLTLATQVAFRAWHAVAHPGAGSLAFAGYVEAHWDQFFLWGRVISALLGVATVALTFLLGSSLLNRSAGLGAAILIGLNPLHIATSQHVSDPNLLALLFVLVAACGILGVVKSGSLRDSAIAGAAIGFAAACKYVPLVLVPIVALAHVPREGCLRNRMTATLRRPGLWVCIAAVALAFFAGSPFTFLDWGTTVRDMSIQHERLLSDWVGQTTYPISLPGYLLSVLPSALGWPAYLLSLVGLALLWRSSRAGWLIASIPIMFILANGMLRTAQERYVLPAVPFLLLSAAAALGSIAAWGAARYRVPFPKRILSLGLLALVAAWPLAGYAATRRALAQPDTRHVARRWIDVHIDRSRPIAVELYGPAFNTLRRDERAAVTWPFYATLAPLVRPAYDFRYLDGLDYIVLSSEVSRRFEAAPRAYPLETAYYAQVTRRTRVVWTSNTARASGPRIEVRALPPCISTRAERDSVFADLLPHPNGSDRLALWCLDMAQLFAGSGDFVRVEEWASRGLHVGALSMNGQLLATLAFAQIGLERPAEAERSARAGIAAAPNNPALHLYLGTALRGQGRDEEALQAFREAFALAPEQELRVAIGETLEHLGRFAEAARVYREAAAVDGDPEQAQRFLAEAARLEAATQGATRR